MYDLQKAYYSDAPGVPTASGGEFIKYRRRPDRVHAVNPILIPASRSPSTLSGFDDVVPMPRAGEIGLPGIGRFSPSLEASPWVSLGLGISAAAAIWFVTRHGTGIAQAVGDLLSFVYGIGLLM
jgi:hypothetical protein